MATLYDIDCRLETLVEEAFDIEDGEILDGDDLTKRFDEVSLALDTKLANIIGFIKNLESDAKAYKEESASLKKRAEQATKKAEWLRQYVDGYIKATVANVPQYKFDSVQGKLSYRKSTSVNVVDPSIVPKDFVKVVVEEKVDKKAIGDKLKKGEEVEGCELETKLNLQIK